MSAMVLKSRRTENEQLHWHCQDAPPSLCWQDWQVARAATATTVAGAGNCSDCLRALPVHDGSESFAGAKLKLRNGIADAE